MLWVLFGTLEAEGRVWGKGIDAMDVATYALDAARLRCLNVPLSILYCLSYFYHPGSS